MSADRDSLLASEKRMPFQKYKAFKPVLLPDRTWPDNAINKAPRWCSVDLRDGNQALVNPMTPDEKPVSYTHLTLPTNREV